MAREALAPGGPAFKAVADRFPGVVSDGLVDRAALAALVFEDPDARRDLEAIVHPVVRRGVAELVRAHVGDLVVVEIPLLVETESAGADVPSSDGGGGESVPAVSAPPRRPSPPPGDGGARGTDLPGSGQPDSERPDSERVSFDRVVVVDVPEAVAVARVVAGRGWSSEAAWDRVRAQASRDARRRRADFVVDNSGDVAGLDREIERLWQWLLAGAPRRTGRDASVAGAS